MRLVTGVGRRLKRDLILKAPPVLAAAGAYYLGAPWYVAALILLSGVYWHGPIVVYFTQRMPIYSSLTVVDDESVLPAVHRTFFHQTMALLQGAGFRNIGRFGCTDEKRQLRATACLLQHPETSDLAHLLVATQDGQAGSAETLAFSRTRIDGSRLWTARDTVQMRVNWSTFLGCLWLGGCPAFHEPLAATRVAAAASRSEDVSPLNIRVRRPELTDPIPGDVPAAAETLS